MGVTGAGTGQLGQPENIWGDWLESIYPHAHFRALLCPFFPDRCPESRAFQAASDSLACNLTSSWVDPQEAPAGD